MRYLKVYESFESDKLYYPIAGREFVQLVDQDPQSMDRIISDRESGQIKVAMSKSLAYNRGTWFGNSKVVRFVIGDIDHPELYFKIYKFVDDWWGVYFRISKSLHIYKCDSFDGLVQCLDRLVEYIDENIHSDISESVSNDVLYKSVTISQAKELNRNRGGKLDIITDSEFNKIDSFFKSIGSPSVEREESILTYIHTDPVRDIVITKGADDWFYVADGIGGAWYGTWYECDGIDGLIQCIESL